MSAMGICSLISARVSAGNAHFRFELEADNARRRIAGEELRLTKMQRLRKYLAHVYPPLREPFVVSSRYDRFFKIGTRENGLARLVGNFVLLEIFGIVLYTLVALQYSANPHRSAVIVSVIVHLFGCILLFFPCVMKIIVLFMWRILFSNMAYVIMLIVIAMAFEGPTMNSAINISQSADSVNCVIGQVTGTVKDIRDSAQDTIESMPESIVGKLVKSLLLPYRDFRDKLRNVYKSVSKVVESVKKHFTSLTKLTKKCQELLIHPHQRCLNAIYEASVACKYNFPFPSTCRPIEGVEILCDTAKSALGAVCRFPGHVKSALVDGAVPFARSSTNPIMKTAKYTLGYQYAQVLSDWKNVKKIQIIFNVSHHNEMKNGFTFNRTAAVLKKEFKAFSEFLLFLDDMILYVLIPLTFIVPFYNECKFVYMFNFHEDYKNVLITSEFREIDAERVQHGYQRLLPLTKIEKRKMGVLWRKWMTTGERGLLILRTIMTIVMMIVPTIFFFLDVVVYEMLYGGYAVTNLLRLDIPDHFEYKIKGDGIIAKIINGILEAFHPVAKGISDADKAWRSCFTEPNPPEWGLFYLQSFLFIVAIILNFVQVYAVRARVFLGNVLYPARRRPRALYLYFYILRNRQDLFEGVKHTKNARDPFIALEQTTRQLMKKRGLSRVQCEQCLKPELRVCDTSNVRACISPSCCAFYCMDCFCYLEKCVECKRPLQWFGKLQLFFEKNDDSVIRKVEKSNRTLYRRVKGTNPVDKEADGNTKEG